jgi:organic radical activating enzyme
MDGPDRGPNTQAAVAYCLAHPRWRLSLQTHKFLGIP